MVESTIEREVLQKIIDGGGVSGMNTSIGVETLTIITVFTGEADRINTDGGAGISLAERGGIKRKGFKLGGPVGV